MQAVAAPPPPKLLQQKQQQYDPLDDSSGSSNMLPAPLASSMDAQPLQQQLLAAAGVPEHGGGFSPEVVLSIEASLANLLDVITVCGGGERGEGGIGRGGRMSSSTSCRQYPAVWYPISGSYGEKEG